ncbi:MAG: flotillin-like protein FloA [Candidatus Wallbacteria bacterium]
MFDNLLLSLAQVGRSANLDSGTFEGLLVIIVIGIIAFVSFILYFVPIPLYIAALMSGVRVSLFTLVAMRFRRIVPSEIINPFIQGVKSGIDTLEISKLEAHYLSGGNVERVISSLIAAQKANIKLDFNKAAAIDLAGRNVLEAVQMSVNPKVIQTPKNSAVAKDGIELLVIAKITVRANIDTLVGGAGESTIMARVGQGVVAAIGAAHTYKEILESPDQIAKHVLQQGLDKNTAFQILSIDIADVEVGKNVGSVLQINQAEADKKVAQAKAEERKSFAVAAEQEMVAREQEMRAKVVEAEAEIPKAIAEAFRNGNLGIMDYYKMKNIQADTDMRSSIAEKA